MFHVEPSDFITIGTFSSVAALVNVAARVYNTKTGNVDIIPIRHTTNSNRTWARDVVSVGVRGLLESISCYADEPVRGETYVHLSVLRGSLANPLGGTLAQGYVSKADDLSWNLGNSRFIDSIDGRGNFRSITGTDPAANTEIIEAVPAGAIWKLTSLRAVMVADANVADRRPALVIDDGATELDREWGDSNITAGQTREVFFSRSSLARTNFGSDQTMGVPLWALMPEGWRIMTETNGIQAGDNWGAPQLWVEEWLID